MKRLIEFSMDDENTILVEVEEEESGYGTKRVSRHDVIEKATIKFDEALVRIKPTINAVIGTLKDLSVNASPDEIQLEFGFKLNTEAGVMLASAGVEANFKVNLKWIRKV